MSAPIAMTAAAIVDADGVRGSAGLRASWTGLGLDPVHGRIRFAPIFQTACHEFRRFDILTRMLVVATEACGLADRLPDRERPATALVFGSASGCLAADRRFAASLAVPSGIEPAVFPYTLPSTCLGEIAIRHRLQGPTLCLSVDDGGEGAAVQCASQLLTAGEAAAALVLVGDWLPHGPGEPAHKTRAAALLLRVTDPDTAAMAAVQDLLPDPLSAVDAILTT